MSLTVKHLNADATFLLTFRPAAWPPFSPVTSSPSFSILLDPWLSGQSNVFHPKFAFSRHTTPSCISTLRDLPEPDLVIVSQDKPDHCHEETLKQLPATASKTLVLAAPIAAKKIRSWKHFDNHRVQSLPKYACRKANDDCVVRIPLPACTAFGSPGEVTIAFIPTRHDLPGVHNAIGITYRPPTSSSPLWGFGLTGSPPGSPTSFESSSTSSYSSVNDRTMSVIFAPHGVSYASIEPYASAHLVSEAALPLTALLHSFDHVQNPWYLGGNISAGVPGGLRIAQSLLARCWISAHDEEKEVGGISTKSCCTRKYKREEVQNLLMQGGGKWATEAAVIEVGGDLEIGAAF
ncbi:MAG: hypothetical protein M1825_001758 [Sarcosagium campestre]|nr:MAG: hypothetical protein M1825_001758 [Sarcosagium campestre]